MFRARNHEGVAAQCLFELLAGGRRMTSDERVRAFTACRFISRKLIEGQGGG